MDQQQDQQQDQQVNPTYDRSKKTITGIVQDNIVLVTIVIRKVNDKYDLVSQKVELVKDNGGNITIIENLLDDASVSGTTDDGINDITYSDFKDTPSESKDTSGSKDTPSESKDPQSESKDVLGSNNIYRAADKEHDNNKYHDGFDRKGVVESEEYDDDFDGGGSQPINNKSSDIYTLPKANKRKIKQVYNRTLHRRKS